MDLFQGLLLITTIHLLAAASPGPDFVMVSQQTLTQGKKAGLLCSLGITLGLSVHILYSSLGLAAVIANSADALLLIKILGGCYLIYLGSKGLRAKASKVIKQNDLNLPASESELKIVGMGIMCNVLNPKAPIYFVSVFTLILSPEMPLYQLAIYGVWMMLIQLVWFSTVVLLLSHPQVNQKFNAAGHWLDRVLGGAMVALGLNLLINQKH